MNLMLIPFVILCGVLLWLVLSFTFHFIGNIIDRIGKHTTKSLDLDAPDENENEKTNEENGGN